MENITRNPIALACFFSFLSVLLVFSRLDKIFQVWCAFAYAPLKARNAGALVLTHVNFHRQVTPCRDFTPTSQRRESDQK